MIVYVCSAWIPTLRTSYALSCACACVGFGPFAMQLPAMPRARARCTARLPWCSTHRVLIWACNPMWPLHGLPLYSRRFKKDYSFTIEMKELLKKNDWCKGLKPNAKLVEKTSIYIPSDQGWDPRSGKPRPSAKPAADAPPLPKTLPVKLAKKPVAAAPFTAVRRPSNESVHSSTAKHRPSDDLPLSQMQRKRQLSAGSRAEADAPARKKPAPLSPNRRPSNEKKSNAMSTMLKRPSVEKPVEMKKKPVKKAGGGSSAFGAALKKAPAPKSAPKKVTPKPKASLNANNLKKREDMAKVKMVDSNAPKRRTASPTGFGRGGEAVDASAAHAAAEMAAKLLENAGVKRSAPDDDDSMAFAEPTKRRRTVTWAPKLESIRFIEPREKANAPPNFANVNKNAQQQRLRELEDEARAGRSGFGALDPGADVFNAMPHQPPSAPPMAGVIATMAWSRPRPGSQRYQTSELFYNFRSDRLQVRRRGRGGGERAP